ncbi:MAG: hypothetical protein R3E12_18395 [Candidatus Eisenbacteria bacterium]
MTARMRVCQTILALVLMGAITTGVTTAVMAACTYFDTTDEGLYDHEYPQLPGYASAAIDLPSGIMQAGDAVEFQVRVEEGQVPTGFGTGTSIGLGDLAVYGNFLGSSSLRRL